MPEHMLSAEEAAEILGLQVRTVRNYLREGRLPGVRIGKQYRIARADIEAFTAGVGATPGSGEGAAGALPGLEPLASARQAAAEVSSVVQIDGMSPPAWERLERTIMAARLAAEGSGSILRVEPLYDAERRRLRLIIVGGAGETAELLRIIELFAPGED